MPSANSDRSAGLLACCIAEHHAGLANWHGNEAHQGLKERLDRGKGLLQETLKASIPETIRKSSPTTRNELCNGLSGGRSPLRASSTAMAGAGTTGWLTSAMPSIFGSIMEGTSSHATGTVTSMESRLSEATQEAACKV